MSFITKEKLAKANEAMKATVNSAGSAVKNTVDTANDLVSGRWHSLMVQKGFPLPFLTKKDGTEVTVTGSTEVLHITQAQADERFAGLKEAEQKLNDAVQAYIDADEKLSAEDKKLKDVIPSWNNISGCYDFSSQEYKDWRAFRAPINALPQFEELTKQWMGEYPLTKKAYLKLIEDGYTFQIINGYSVEISAEYDRFLTKAKNFRKQLVHLLEESAFILACREAFIKLNKMGEYADNSKVITNEEELMQQLRDSWIDEMSSRDYVSTIAKECGYTINPVTHQLVFENEKDIIIAIICEKLWDLAQKAYFYESRQEFIDMMSHGDFLSAPREFCLGLKSFNTNPDGTSPFEYPVYRNVDGVITPVTDEDGNILHKSVTTNHLLARMSEFFDVDYGIDDTDLAYIVGASVEEVVKFRAIRNQNSGKTEKIEIFSGKYGFLSNFYSVGVTITDKDGISYTNMEAYFQAQKVLPGQRGLNIKEGFANLDPKLAKTRGNKLPFIRKDWEKIKEQVMLEGLRQKFAPGSELAEKLIATCDMELIEGNNHGDTEWGVVNGVGDNKLGKLLMKVRSELLEAAAPV